MTSGTPKKKSSRRSGKLPEPLSLSSVDSQDNPSTLDVSSVREVAETQFVDTDGGIMDDEELDEEEPDSVYQQVQELEDAIWNVRNDIGELKELDHARNRRLEKREEKQNAQEKALERLTSMMADLASNVRDETAEIQGVRPAGEPRGTTPVPGGNCQLGPEESQCTFSLGHHDWVVQLEEEARIAEFNPADDTRTPRPATMPVMAQVRLPAGLPTFGCNLSTDVPDIIDYANLMETHLYGANLEPDDFGCRAVISTVGPCLSTQIMRHATYKGRNPNWRAMVYWLLKLAPKAISETEAQMLMEEIHMHNFDSAVDFVSAFKALRFRAGPQLGKENAMELLFRAVGKTYALYIQQMAHTMYGRRVDICQLENELVEAQSQQWLIADDETLMRKHQQHMAKLRHQYWIPNKPLSKETRGFENNERPKFQQQKPQNRSGLYNRYKENCSAPAVKQIELQEIDGISADEQDEIQQASEAEVDGNSEGEVDDAEDLDFYQVTVDDDNQETNLGAEECTDISQVIVAPAVTAQLQNELGKVSGLSPTTIWVETHKHPKWTLPVTLRTSSVSIQTEAEIDSGADRTMVSRGLAAELGANIQPLIGQVRMAD
ncbi:hypothetical protein COEREDRAFT_7544 [Coemansia reversa NRRL 1564]|uniref:Uncharacterized protein n=1 Tax=Coemansia reversa (strain ATCC 12441 / NRRL 1564) TaxID=763665 RepID=A0A2G5BF08_COERN|nr:hypothetical protein COEREDRAFT_7544 [Coemansia reversa NRRL 1564]|eukprot:PIA17581.1 hypothetical protein COEREDRAFT_7544 [Coemansia reversa NRRL 1564]